MGIASNLDFAHWTEVFGHERMTAALLDRLARRASVLQFAGQSFRLRHSIGQQGAGAGVGKARGNGATRGDGDVG